MNCQAITDFKKYIVDNIPGIMAFLVSALSLWISWKTFKRDQIQLKLLIYPAQTWGGTNLDKLQSGLGIDISNPSRSPVKLGSLGGSCRYYTLRTLAMKILGRFTPKSWEPYMFLWDGPHINPYLRPNGQPLTLAAGDRLTFIIPDPGGKDLGEHIAVKASSLHIFDGIGNKYLLPQAAFKKLRRTYSK